MALGERCTRACGFCLVDTRKPQAIDHDEPKRIAKAVNQMNLEYAVITMVARDDLKDGGANHIREIINEVRYLNPQTSVEVLIFDLKDLRPLKKFSNVLFTAKNLDCSFLIN